MLAKKRVKYWPLSDGDQIENSSNSGNTVANRVDGNPEPSRETGRCNDYAKAVHFERSGNGESVQN